MNDSLDTVLPRFIEHLQGKGRSPSTVLAYKSDLEQLIKYLREQRKKALVGQINQMDLEGFRDYLLVQKYTAKSASRKLNAVKTFFRWMKTEKIVGEDHSKSVSHPKIEASNPKFLSQLEYRALRDVVRSDARIAAIVEIILQTGIRISEVANLKMDSIVENKIQIEAYATQPARDIYMNDAARGAIGEYLNERPKSDSPFVFVSKNGKPLAVRNIRAAIDRYMQKADIPGYSVNDLRTTFIIENLRRGVDLVTISQAAGHKRVSTTERYLEMAGVSEAGKKQRLEVL